MVVMREQQRVYDERFHEGVNIIRGAKDVNSVGKSTIANLIFYSLGGEGVVWVQEALLCSSVYSEVELNGVVVTLQRDISAEKIRPMAIYWGDLDAAISAPVAEWKRYSFSQSSDAQTFTHVLYQALRIPDVKDQLASRLTTHQLLRLMFADQASPPSELYRSEQFSGKDVHDAIGSLLCGIYDSRIYEIGLNVRNKQQERDEIAGRLKALWSMLGSTDQAMGLDILQSQLNDAETSLQTKLEGLSKEASGPSIAAAPVASDYEQKRQQLSKEVREVSAEVARLEEERGQVLFDIEDSAELIEALSVNAKSLEESAQIRTSLGGIDFAFCPACFSPLERTSSDGCVVCKSPPDKKHQNAHLSRMRQELSLQLEESQKLQSQRVVRRDEIDRQLPATKSRYVLLKKEYDQLVATVMTPTEFAHAESFREVGYLTRTVEDLRQKVELAKSISGLETTKASLESEISKLMDERSRLESSREERQKVAHDAIRTQIADIVAHDLPFEEAFKNVIADDVSFSFAENNVKIAGRRNFSASSLVILKNSFHAGLLFASAEYEFFRYPRFALFDNTEDKGMTPARSHNFQEVLAAKSKQSKSRHQIILTTSMIAPSLNNSEYTIGDEYNSDHKSLNIGRKSKVSASKSEGSG